MVGIGLVLVVGCRIYRVRGARGLYGCLVGCGGLLEGVRWVCRLVVRELGLDIWRF